MLLWTELDADGYIGILLIFAGEWEDVRVIRLGEWGYRGMLDCDVSSLREFEFVLATNS